MNLADLKSLVSVGEVPPDPTESRRKKSPVSRKRDKEHTVKKSDISIFFRDEKIYKLKFINF